MSEDTAGRKTVEVQRKVLARNDEMAEQNRAWLKSHGVTAVNITSSPGAGKTTLLERTLERLQGRVGCGVIVGDLQTDNDAKRLSGKGARVQQIETVNSCHLDAARVGALIPEIAAEGTKLLFIENVGNLVCPASFDLGEDHKIVLFSTTEGEDKPLKYPVIFSRSKLVIITKIDLAPHVEWERAKALDSLRKACPAAEVLELSAKSGEGMDKWIEYLEEYNI